ncbi:hypothetical protein OG218_02150 [Kineococcus sp. NBC_00420]|uniref:hypothetical protein n=1 Tax=Kineococcus sp. NBC_00420 TaxID=2903564 RepID=UPI002E1AEC57
MHLLTHPAALTLYTVVGAIAFAVVAAAFLRRDQPGPTSTPGAAASPTRGANPTVKLVVQFLALSTLPVMVVGLVLVSWGVFSGALPLPDALAWLDGFARTGWEGIAGVVEHLAHLVCEGGGRTLVQQPPPALPPRCCTPGPPPGDSAVGARNRCTPARNPPAQNTVTLSCTMSGDTPSR